MPVMSCLVGWSALMVRTVEAQFAVTKGSVYEGAVMGVHGIVVSEGPEEATGHAHPGNRDATFFLQRADHRD